MTEEEYREAERLRSQINDVINRINYVNHENAQLEAELDMAIRNVGVLIGNCREMDKAVYEEMGYLSGVVGNADVCTKEVFQALNELTAQYFTFKELSSATKKVTQYNDEYYTRFSNYHELRRITLGYVVGLDSNIIGDETLRKKVEKAYLQNTEYWLAYCISAVMLWKSNEKEAAQRAMSKSLSINYFNSCLFYLLINLRFGRIDAAKKWYVNYLDRVDMNNLGDEWQYLLQAYLFGAFGADEEFEDIVAKSFKKMLAQVEVTTVDFAKKFTARALQFAELYVHKTDYNFTILGRTCDEYPQMIELLSTAEKNTEIAKYYDSLSSAEIKETEKLSQRIENVLYSLISDYDAEELKVVQSIKYNEAVISAKGDVSIASANYKEMFSELNKKKNLGDLLLSWAFASDTSQTDVSVRKFAISFMKEAVVKGFVKFAENYRVKEKDTYKFNIDECILECNEESYSEAQKKIDKYYDKNKVKDITKDKQVLIYSGICVVALILILVLLIFFSPVILTLGILAGLAGSFLLWRRIVDLGKIRQEKKRKSKLLLKQALDELKQWRATYKEADSKNADLIDAMNKF